MIVTLLVSTGAAWESRALAAFTEHPGIVVLKRCVDVDDMLATASAGQAQVAVLGAELRGLDPTVIDQLRGYDVRVVAVVPDDDAARARALRIGIDVVVPADRIDDLADAVVEDAGPALSAPPTVPSTPEVAASAPSGRVIAVWGPGGAPGRTTVAGAIAAELALRGRTTLLVDADPYGGAVGQQLGVLDEVSGLLSAARLVASGSIDHRFATVQRRLSDHLLVMTGLPRPDRWVEVRPGALAAIIERARADAQVVLDTGFSIEQDPTADVGIRPDRNGLTVEALEAADEILLVGSAEPVGLARLVRAITEAHEVLPEPVLRIVVNRMRPTLGWREADVTTMLAGFGNTVGVHFLPDDQSAVDRAGLAGRTLIETGESPLTRAVAGLVDAMVRR